MRDFDLCSAPTELCITGPKMRIEFIASLIQTCTHIHQLEELHTRPRCKNYAQRQCAQQHTRTTGPKSSQGMHPTKVRTQRLHPNWNYTHRKHQYKNYTHLNCAHRYYWHKVTLHTETTCTKVLCTQKTHAQRCFTHRNHMHKLNCTPCKSLHKNCTHRDYVTGTSDS